MASPSQALTSKAAFQTELNWLATLTDKEFHDVLEYDFYWFSTFDRIVCAAKCCNINTVGAANTFQILGEVRASVIEQVAEIQK